MAGVKKPRCRSAKPEDALEIFAVLVEVACEIPVCIKDDDREKVIEKIQAQVGMRKSLVATDAMGRIVALLLVEPRAAGNKLVLDGEPQPAGLNLLYGGVTKSWRGKHIFPAMIDKMKRRGLPLFAAVRHDNKGHMAERLIKLGFEKVGTLFEEDKFRWLPNQGAER